MASFKDANPLKVNMDPNNPIFDKMISFMGDEFDQVQKKELRRNKMQKRKAKLENIEDYVTTN
jgi:hypothetical protein